MIHVLKENMSLYTAGFCRCTSGAVLRGSCLLLAVAALFAGDAVADEYRNGKVDHVIDGDSLIVDVAGHQREVRLWGIDSPEYDQPGAQISTAALHRLADGRSVRLHIKYRDRYGREVAELYQAGTNINEKLVSGGYSWVHPYYCREPVCRSWNELEAEARRKRIGIWGSDNPIPPWRWKKRG